MIAAGKIPGVGDVGVHALVGEPETQGVDHYAAYGLAPCVIDGAGDDRRVRYDYLGRLAVVECVDVEHYLACG